MTRSFSVIFLIVKLLHVKFIIKKPSLNTILELESRVRPIAKDKIRKDNGR